MERTVGAHQTLVLDYDTYVSAFSGRPDGSVTTYPTVDPNVKTALISDYERRAERHLDRGRNFATPRTWPVRL